MENDEDYLSRGRVRTSYEIGRQWYNKITIHIPRQRIKRQARKINVETIQQNSNVKVLGNSTFHNTIQLALIVILTGRNRKYSDTIGFTTLIFSR